MQTAFRCKSCKYVHVGRVSSCDCDNKPFAYTLVHIIDVPENEDEVPEFKSLMHSREPRFVNYEHGNLLNGVYAHVGKRESGRADVQVMGNMGSTFEKRDVGSKLIDLNMKANCVLATAGPDLLEVAYMAYQYFHTKRLVQGSSPRVDNQIKLLAEAIKKATDLSPFRTKQNVRDDD